jgi:hypothetical protein
MTVRSNFSIGTRRLASKGLRRADRSFETVKVAATMLAENIITGGAYSPGTPRDTGAAAYSWTVHGPGESAKPFTTEPPDADGLASVGEATTRIAAWNGKTRLHFGTRCPYMDPLEYEGHSPQAPSGFVRLALRHWKTMLNAAARLTRAKGAPRARDSRGRFVKGG